MTDQAFANQSSACSKTLKIFGRRDQIMAWSTDHTPRPHLWSIKESRCVTAPSNQRAQWMRDPRPHLTWDWLGWGRTLEMFGPPSRLVELDAAAGAYPALAGYFKGEIVTAWRPEPLASMSRGGSLADRTCAVTRLVWQPGTTCLVRLGTTTILMCSRPTRGLHVWNDGIYGSALPRLLIKAFNK